MTTKTASNLSTKEALLLLQRSLKNNKYPENYLQVLSDYIKLSLLDDNALLTSQQMSLLNHVLFELDSDVPVEYIIGKAFFYGLEFKTNKNTLIPRPFTELLVETGISERLKRDRETTSFIDIGTGTGAIIITLAATLKRDYAKVYKKTNFSAIDISADTLAVAKENIAQHKLTKIIKLFEANVFPESKSFFGTLYKNCIIITNPPYIELDDYIKLQKSVKDYEPALALVKNPAFDIRLQEFITKLKAEGHTVMVIREDTRNNQEPFLTVTRE